MDSTFAQNCSTFTCVRVCVSHISAFGYDTHFPLVVVGVVDVVGVIVMEGLASLGDLFGVGV